MQWRSVWRRLKSARKQRLMDEMTDAGIDTFGLMSRAEILAGCN
jgi:hypothetical protein